MLPINADALPAFLVNGSIAIAVVFGEVAKQRAV